MQSKRNTRVWAAFALAAGLLLSACSEAESDEPTTDLSAAEVKAVKGSDLMSVTLIQSAINRLGVETTPVETRRVPVGYTGGPMVERRVVPYSAVLYDADGKTWAFVNTEGRTFMREPLTISYEKDGVAVLTAGPSVGTEVVTVGAVELYGSELGIDVD
jgi:ABC-type oligopeptide transport system substrate-binding subunit